MRKGGNLRVQTNTKQLVMAAVDNLTRFVIAGMGMAFFSLAAGALAAVYAPEKKALTAFVFAAFLAFVWVMEKGQQSFRAALGDPAGEDLEVWGLTRFLPVFGGFSLGFFPVVYYGWSLFFALGVAGLKF